MLFSPTVAFVINKTEGILISLFNTVNLAEAVTIVTAAAVSVSCFVSVFSLNQLLGA